MLFSFPRCTGAHSALLTMNIRKDSICPSHPGGFGSQKSRKHKGPWKWLQEKERVLQNRQFGYFCRVTLISAALEAGNPRNTRGLGNGVLQNRQFWCFCGVSPISAALEAGNPRNTRVLGNGLRKRSGYCKIDNFCAFMGFHPFY